MHSKNNVIIVGSGIAGLSLAYSLAKRGFSVSILEKDDYPAGASVRNFGTIWPIGQPYGDTYFISLRSREIWYDIAKEIGIYFNTGGSLITAYHEIEWRVLQELESQFKCEGRDVHLVSPHYISSRYPLVNSSQLFGGLWSATECIVNPREAIPKLVTYLQERFSIKFFWNTPVQMVESGKILTSHKFFYGDLIFICTGSDIMLIHSDYMIRPLTKCKLQMLRMLDPTHVSGLDIAVCSGLSLLHYKSFHNSPSWSDLYEHMLISKPDYLSHKIHVMISMLPDGSYIVGDSHIYADSFDPFEKNEIYDLITAELHRIVKSDNWKTLEVWHGIYLKTTNDDVCWFEELMPDVFVFNGLGGAGMTLSFGLSERIASQFE